MSTLFASVGPEEAVLATDTRTTWGPRDYEDGNLKIHQLAPRLLITTAGCVATGMDAVEYIKAHAKEMTPSAAADALMEFLEPKHGQARLRGLLLGEEDGRFVIVQVVGKRHGKLDYDQLPPDFDFYQEAPEMPYEKRVHREQDGARTFVCVPDVPGLKEIWSLGSLPGMSHRTVAALAINQVSKYRERSNDQANIWVLPREGPAFNAGMHTLAGDPIATLKALDGNARRLFGASNSGDYSPESVQTVHIEQNAVSGLEILEVIDNTGAQTTSQAFVDIPGFAINVTLEQPATVLLYYTLDAYANNTASGVYGVQVDARLLVDGAPAPGSDRILSRVAVGHVGGGPDQWVFIRGTLAAVTAKELSAGQHTIKAQFRVGTASYIDPSKTRATAFHRILGAQIFKR